jgi:hypothetical protein
MYYFVRITQAYIILLFHRTAHNIIMILQINIFQFPTIND